VWDAPCVGCPMCGSVCVSSGGSVDCADCVMRRAWPGTLAGLAPSVSQSELAHPLRGLSTALQNPPRGRGDECCVTL
jgi:hypothetical protein